VEIGVFEGGGSVRSNFHVEDVLCEPFLHGYLDSECLTSYKYSVTDMEYAIHT